VDSVERIIGDLGREFVPQQRGSGVIATALSEQRQLPSCLRPKFRRQPYIEACEQAA